MSNTNYEQSSRNIVTSENALTAKKIESHTDSYETNEMDHFALLREKLFFNSQYSKYQTINGATKLLMITCGIFPFFFAAFFDILTLIPVGNMVCNACHIDNTILKGIITVIIIIVFLGVEVSLAALIAKGTDKNDTEKFSLQTKISHKILAGILCFLPATLYYISKIGLLAELSHQSALYIHAQKVYTYVVCALSIGTHIVAMFLFKYTALAWQYYLLYLRPKRKLDRKEAQLKTSLAGLRNDLVSEFYPSYDQQLNAIDAIQKLSPGELIIAMGLSSKALALRHRLTIGNSQLKLIGN